MVDKGIELKKRTTPIKVDARFIKAMEFYRQPDKTKGVVEGGSKSVVVFSEHMLGIKPYAWQVYSLVQIQRAIENRTGDDQVKITEFGKGDKDGGFVVEVGDREFVLITSRQIGKSTLLAILALWCCIYNKVPGTNYNNTVFGITSASDTQAKKLLHEMKKMILLGNAYMAEKYTDNEGKPVFGKKFFSNLLAPDEPNNTTTITFKVYNEKVHGPFILKGAKFGCVIKSYPPTSVVLGETFTVVVVDEAGKTDKISDIFYEEYIYPTGNSTDAIRVNTSTPWETSGFFYRLVNPDGLYNDSGAIIIMFDINAIEIENPKYHQTVMKKVRSMEADGKIDEVQRAYYCRFVKGEQAYFKPHKVFEMFKSNVEMVHEFKGMCDLGIDFGGQTKSKSALTVTHLDVETGIIHRLWKKTYPVGKDGNLLEDIENIVLPRFNIQRMIPDDCPQGDFMIRKMREKGWNVTPMNFRTDKVKKYGAFRAMLNRNKVESFDDRELKTEMLALENSHGKRQSVIMAAPGYTDDEIDSFVLSCYHFLEEENSTKFYSYYDD